MNNLVTRSGIVAFLSKMEKTTTVDVRTPSEYAYGHIPGAVNIPMFTDNERAEVGMTYKKKGRDKAVVQGFEFVGPRLASMLKEGIIQAGKEKELQLYCWRGGMRSESMAWLFSRVGINCYILEEGYKNYRKHILSELEGDFNLVIVGGFTGSGKTEILKELAVMGEQVIDLEAIANHRGSAFGGLGRDKQPSSEHFGNLLYQAITPLDRTRHIFVEDESRAIGSLFMPDEFYSKIRKANLVAITLPAEKRIPFLVKEYGGFDKQLLKQSVKKITKRLGNEKADIAIEHIRNGNIADAVAIVLDYYDKTYEYGLDKRDNERVEVLKVSTMDPSENAAKILEALNKRGW